MNNSQWTRGNRPKITPPSTIVVCLVTATSNNAAEVGIEPDRFVTEAFYTNGQGEGGSGKHGWYVDGLPADHLTVHAWMKKPEPYSG